jgi:hypothetical protein
MFPDRASGPTSPGWSAGLRPAFLALFVLLAVAISRPLLSAEPVDPLAVDPGTLVRWPGHGSHSCFIGEDEWPAIDDTCWYPIDILTADGPLVLGRIRDGATEHTTVHVAPYPYPEQRLTVDPEMVHPPDDQLERIRMEAERVAALWHRPGPPRFTLPLTPPLRPLPDGRSFGSRRVLNDEPRSPHSGVDFSCVTGTPVFGVADGIVVLADEHYFAGKSIYVDHGDQLVSMYFHLSEISVAEGDAVTAGDTIGAVGATGRATGAHLHFGIRWHGARIDPRVLLGSPSKITTIGE